MKRALVAAVISLTLAGLLTPAAAARKPKLGVFGTIDGMKLKATPKKKVKNLVQATYRVDPELGTAILTLAASELPKLHGAFQVVVISCLSNTTALPWTADCIASYSEAQFKHRAFAQKIWVSSVDVGPNLELVGSFHVTVESFDGTTVRGQFSGSLDSNQLCTPGCVDASDLGTVSGEGTFTVPITF